MPIAPQPLALSARLGRASSVIPPGHASSVRATLLSQKNERLSGTTLDASGQPLGSCVVHLFRTPSDVLVAQTTSDGAGAYVFDNPGSGPFYVVAYKALAPDVAGTTANTLAAE